MTRKINFVIFIPNNNLTVKEVKSVLCLIKKLANYRTLKNKRELKNTKYIII